jgi:hypothetical protein
LFSDEDVVNKTLEPTAVMPFVMTITDNITSPASVTPLSTAAAQLGRYARQQFAATAHE